MRVDFDIAIAGSGFAGSLLALILRRLGHSVVMLERGRHPRFVIGESSTPLANLLLEQLAARYDLPNIGSFSKWGTWQAHHPGIGCGLKRGFTFYHHDPGQPWQPVPDRRNELLVAASPRDGIADTHWYRPDLDHYLVKQAQAAGVHYMEDTCVTNIAVECNGITVDAIRRNQPVPMSARFLIDATGPRGGLQTLLGVKHHAMEFMPATAGVYTHFRGVRRMDECYPPAEAPPYPPDDAAVHHVFPGGWAWVLQFNNGITSAGVSATAEVADRLGFARGEAGWRRLLDQFPTLNVLFRDAQAVLPFTYAPRLCFRAARMHGPRWAMLPSAAGFVDPLLSTGFPLALLGIQRLAGIIERSWKSSAFQEGIASYAEQTRNEFRAAEHLVAALYSTMGDFELFTRISLLYFAAASYTEAALRLGRLDLAGDSFLQPPRFAPAMRECLDAVLTRSADRATIVRAISDAIQIADVAGLGDFSRLNWYPARGEDLIASAAKLDSSELEIRAMLRRTGFSG